MKRFYIRFALILTVVAVTVLKVAGQPAGLPDVFLKNTVKDQLNYLDEHTKIYENYRAIREDMFQKIKSNVSDTMSLMNLKISGLQKTRANLNLTIDSLRASLGSTRTGLDEMTKTKNSISVLGLNVNKSAYNRIMWTILGGLIAALLIGILIFKRNLSTILSTRKEYQDLKNEFEAYRKSSREAREKMTMDHFNEIKRIRAGG